MLNFDFATNFAANRTLSPTKTEKQYPTWIFINTCNHPIHVPFYFLSDLSGVQNEHSVAPRDGVESVCDCERCAVFKRLANRRLDLRVSFSVNRRRCFVENQNLKTYKYTQYCSHYLSVLHLVLFVTFECLNSARAKHISCRSPTEKFSPFSKTTDSSCNSKLAT